MSDDVDLRDAEMNQYTTTPFDSREYDANGNLIHICDERPPDPPTVEAAGSRYLAITDACGHGRLRLS